LEVDLPETGKPSQSLGQAVRVGSIAPDFTLPELDGSEITLSALRGNVVLINFWTTWCPPCRYEMPALQETYRRFKDDGFIVLAVNWTQLDEREAVAPYVQELGLSFPILLDENGQISDHLYNVIGLPTSIFVDGDGVVQEIVVGPLSLGDLDTKVQSLLQRNL
jgi:peroxiredoxin